MKKHGPLLALLLISIFLHGCDSDDPTAENTKARKLSYYSEWFEIADLGFKPMTKVKYEYNDSDQLIKKTIYGYDPDDQSLIELRYLVFTYSSNQVDKITSYQTGSETPYTEHTYEYGADHSVSLIKENNYAAGVTSQVAFTYDRENSKITASYTFSNGGMFDYEFYLQNNNMISDKTVKGAQLCSTGAYTYDNGINPFSQLGYVEYELTNYSVNNRLTENVDYVGCAFPTLIPESYSYVYDDRGYPITATTLYRSGGNINKSQKLFIYE